MSALDLTGIAHRYAGAPVPTLDGLDLAVPEGAMLSIVGPSGSGKSTVLKIVAGLEQPTAGSVRIGGADVHGVPTERRDATVMFQDPVLFDHLDVAGNVAFGPRLAGLSRRAARRSAERYLRLVHLEGLGRRPVGSLSGGQQQRVALARALAVERGVLLLDEPFSSLDPALRDAMHELLGEVRAALSPTTVLVTHDVDEAALAETTAVLVDGRLHQLGPMADLYCRPASLEVAHLLGGFVEVPGRVDDGVHASAWGAVPVDAPDGDGTLLVRREFVLPREPGPGSSEGGVVLAREARVVALRSAGPRTLARLCAPGRDGTELRCDVELPLGDSVTPGARVDLFLPPTAPRCVVPATPTPGSVDSQPKGVTSRASVDSQPHPAE